MITDSDFKLICQMLSDELEQLGHDSEAKIFRIISELPRIHYLPKILLQDNEFYHRMWFMNGMNENIRIANWRQSVVGSIDHIFHKKGNYQFKIKNFIYNIGTTSNFDWIKWLISIKELIEDTFLISNIDKLINEYIPFPKTKSTNPTIRYHNTVIHATKSNHKDYDFSIGGFKCKFV